MLAHGYRFVAMRRVRTAPVGADAPSAPDYTGPSTSISIGGADDEEADDEAAANNEAALAASEAATQMTNDGIAQTVQGINGQ